MAVSFVGTQESTGRNDGAAIEAFLTSVGRRKGDSWCAAFVSYCLEKAGASSPSVRSGLARTFKRSPHTIRAERVLRRSVNVAKGATVGWEKGTTISGHIGFVTDEWSGASGRTVEGNTSSGKIGSQADGDGVYYRFRTIQPGNYFRITWFTEVKYGNSK